MREKRENLKGQQQLERQAEIDARRAARLAPLSLARPAPRLTLPPTSNETRDSVEV
jgi:hypothetical protein